ncbi:MAG: acetylornithine/succinylornithine family transaminase [Oscillospiraceae bacterium]
MDIKTLDNEYIMGTYNRQNLSIVRGNSATCFDENGKEYIDFSSGIGVNSLGYCDNQWSFAVAKQAYLLQHTSNLYYTQPAVKLAKVLCEKTGYKKALFCNSGAEANEAAIKLARKYSFDKYGSTVNRNKILTLRNSFHGRTITTLSATGQEVFHNYFFPFTEGFEFASPKDIDEVLFILNSGGYCGVMIELIQGEGGVVPLGLNFVKTLFDFCEKNDILTIVDEVQTGIGRTGKLLASEHFGVKPNITSLAKGLGGGLPIGAIITDAKTCDVFGFSDHGTTFGGNPVVCAGAYVVLNRIVNDNFLAQVKAKGEYIEWELASIPEIAGIDGMGMMLGIRLKSKNAGEIVKKGIEKGLILLTAKDKIRLLPPLNITMEELDKGLSILKEVLS